MQRAWKQWSPTRPPDVPEIKLDNGVHVCSIDSSKAEKMRQIVESFDVWRDRGIILMHEEDKMRANLVDADRKVLDEVHDKLHEAGKMEWMLQPSRFASPVFVVWRLVNGKKKGRVVVDLRALNKASVPDVYPIGLDGVVSHVQSGLNNTSQLPGWKVASWNFLQVFDLDLIMYLAVVEFNDPLGLDHWCRRSNRDCLNFSDEFTEALPAPPLLVLGDLVDLLVYHHLRQGLQCRKELRNLGRYPMYHACPNVITCMDSINRGKFM